MNGQTSTLMGGVLQTAYTFDTEAGARNSGTGTQTLGVDSRMTRKTIESLPDSRKTIESNMDESNLGQQLG